MHNYCGYQFAKKRALGSILPRLPIMGILEVFSDIPIIGILGVRIDCECTLYALVSEIIATRYRVWVFVECRGLDVEGRGFKVEGRGLAVEGSGSQVEGQGLKWRVDDRKVEVELRSYYISYHPMGTRCEKTRI